MKRWFLFASAAALAFVVVFVVVFAFYSGPAFKYRFSSRSIESDCLSIHAGMTKSEVLEVVHKKTAPYFEDSFTPNSLSFSRLGGSCTVEFDQQTGETTKSSVARVAGSSDLSLGDFE